MNNTEHEVKNTVENIRRPENALTTVDSQNIISGIQQANNSFYCSMTGEDSKTRALVYNAMTNPDVKLSDHIGKQLTMRDVIVEQVSILDEVTGEVRTSPRVILIDTDGHSYGCTSYTVFNAIRRIIQIYGAPTWESGITVQVSQITRGAKRYFSLTVVD